MRLKNKLIKTCLAASMNDLLQEIASQIHEFMNHSTMVVPNIIPGLTVQKEFFFRSQKKCLH